MATKKSPGKAVVPEIKMTRDVKLTVQWKEFGSKLTEVVAQGFLTAAGGDGVSGGISALIGALGTIKMEAPPGEKAWSLAVLSFAWALDELKALPGTEIYLLRPVIDAALADAKKDVDAGGEFMPITFLDRPTTLPLYRALRDAIVARKDTFRSGIHEPDEALKARFDSAYDRAIFEVLARRSDLYQSLVLLLSSPASSAAERQLNWVTYRSRLVFEFEVRPVFGQEVTRLSLSQLYVPLRCYWAKQDIVSDDKVQMGLTQTHDVGMLDELLDGWVRAKTEEDITRLIGGGPGSGKSTTLRAFARRMAEHPEFRPLFIPLQHIDLEGDLREAINRYFLDRTNGPFTQAPLARTAIEDGPALVLIFDGLDELARPGEAANEVVNLFATKLTNLISSLRGDGSRSVKVVVSGRMPSFQAARRFLSPPKHGCLEVYGFTPEPNGAFRRDCEELWKLDQRPVWWRQYATLFGIAIDVPPAFAGNELEGITHEPLLCYLLVLSGYATEDWEKAAENPNRIYKSLVDSIWDRGWGEGPIKRQGPGRTLSKVDFNALMQTIALAAWQGGDTRVASEHGFANALKIARAERAWENFKYDNGADVTNLAMNFYLKAAETGQRGFEFTHKSFGDYLAARAILDLTHELEVFIERSVSHAMTDWVAATGSGSLSNEILTFLRDEVRLRVTDSTYGYTLAKVTSSKTLFEKFIGTILSDGLPAAVGAPIWRVSEMRQRNGEIMAWAIINSFTLTIARLSGPEKQVIVKWPDKKKSFSNLLRRLLVNTSSENPVLSCFSYIVAPEADLFGLSLIGIDLRGAQMKSASFAGCHLIKANLEGANLDNCNFQRAMLEGAELDGASLRGADLTDARLDVRTTNHVKYVIVNNKPIVEKTSKKIDLAGALISEVTLLFADLDWFTAESAGLAWDSDDFRSVVSDQKGDIFSRAPKIRRLMRLIKSKQVGDNDASNPL